MFKLLFETGRIFLTLLESVAQMILGVLFAIFMIGIVTIKVADLWYRVIPIARIALVIVVIAVIALEGIYLAKCVKAMGVMIKHAEKWSLRQLLGDPSSMQALPLIPMAAAGMPKFPLLCRPFISLFWLAHLACGAYACFVFSGLGNQPGLLPMLYKGVISLCYSYITFGYVLLCIAMFDDTSDSIMTAWRARPLWSLFFAVGTYSISLIPDWIMRDML